MIHIHQLERHYDGTFHALGPLDLQVITGEFLCILGESGCGKSSLLRIMAGIEQADRGSIRFTTEDENGRRHRVGYVPQASTLLPWLSARENIALGYRLRGERPQMQAIDQAMKLTGIAAFSKAKPRQLSGGIAQRVAIARAIVHGPDLLLMDEPFSSLDAINRARMHVELIRIWQSLRMTVVFITHDIEEACVLGTRIAMFTARPGKIAKLINIELPPFRDRSSDEFLKVYGEVAKFLNHSVSNSIHDKYGK